MDFYQQISEFIEDESYIPMKSKDLFVILGGQTETERKDFSAALERLCGEGRVVISKRGKILSAQKAGVITGVFSASSRGFGFVKPDSAKESDNGSDLFIPFRDSLGAIDGDRVLCTLSTKRTGANAEGRIIQITEHSVKSVIGVVVEIRGTRGMRTRFAIQPDSRRLSFLVYVDNAAQTGALPGTKAEAYITCYPDAERDALGHITAVFGEAKSTGANYTAILHEHAIKTKFNRTALAQADKLAKESPLPQGRLDLRGEMIFTIDGEDAKDLDDAISLRRTQNGFELGVHIADVSYYVREGSALDKEAFARGTSVYFADQVVPMLPKALSNGICSLNEGEDRYTLSAFITLDENGKIQGTQIRETIICSKIRGVYSELNDVAANGTGSRFHQKYAALFPAPFSDMLDLYRILEGNAKRRGAIELETTESKIILDEDKNPVRIMKRARGMTERLIEQFMLCANEAVATWLYEKRMPCVYRIHEEPSGEKLHNLRLFAANAGLDVRPLKEKKIHPKALQSVMNEARQKGIDSVISTVMLRAMMKARYSEVSSPHFGLAIERYCHFTSPIRRYPDLATHRIIRKILNGGVCDRELITMQSFAQRAAAASSENEKRAMSAEREIEELYKCVYMQSRIGQRYEGRICSVTGFGLFVELENTCEGLIPIGTMHGYFTFNERNMTLQSDRVTYRLGDALRVKIEETDIATRRVYMSIDE